MVGLLLVTFGITGAATYWYFKSSNEVYHRERVERKADAILQSVEYFFREERESEFFPFYTKRFDEKIKEFSDIHALTINVYDLNGMLITSSDMEYFSSRPKEKYVPRTVVKRLEQGEYTVTIDQVNEERDHLAVYAYLKNPEETPIAIINVPYFYSLEATRNETYDFLKSLGFIYLGMFLLALLISYYLAQYITQSLKTIGEKIKSIRINQKNEPLSWPSRDDIGLLVEEYNRTVLALEESAKNLARSERESAWREMAKQVAHEIKNPLTPMKLSVQQLDRAWVDKKLDFENRLVRFRETMIEQINALSDIANEFSNFAKMPRSEITEVNLEDSINASLDLFKKSTEVSLKFQSSVKNNPIILADKGELLRVFNNIIKNAIQAIPKNKKGKVEIVLSEKPDLFKVEISDNGEGIPKELQENLFMPNFTTKSKGMGMGLAIVKNIISGIKGSITFTSTQKGTTFTILFQKPIK